MEMGRVNGRGKRRGGWEGREKGRVKGRDKEDGREGKERGVVSPLMSHKNRRHWTIRRGHGSWLQCLVANFHASLSEL